MKLIQRGTQMMILLKILTNKVALYPITLHMHIYSFLSILVNVSDQL